MPTGKLRVWLWNGEDPIDELERRITAACVRHKVSGSDLENRLFVDSGRDTRFVVMREIRKELVVAEPVVEAIVHEIQTRQIDVLIVDPFVTTHEVPESDNSAIARVAYLWSGIADRTKCAIVLVHHARKTNGNEVTAEDARGAVALVGAARLVRVLNPMSKDEAEAYGVDPAERFSYVRVSDGKANLARRVDRGEWFRLTSVNLKNGRGNLDGDEVAVVERWAPKVEALTAEEIAAVQAEVDQAPCRADSRSPQWVGNAIVRALRIDPEKPGAKARVRKCVDALLTAKRLVIVDGIDEARRVKQFVEVGERVQ